MNFEGFVDEITHKRISGWARNTDSNEKVIVEIVINRRHVYSIKAGDYRIDLNESGLGNSAFVFEMPPFFNTSNISEIIVRPKGSITPLSSGYYTNIISSETFPNVIDDQATKELKDTLLGNQVRGVILITSRVGSTHLVSLLRQHPNVIFFSEPLSLIAHHGNDKQFEWIGSLFITPQRVEYPIPIKVPHLIGFSTKLDDIDGLKSFSALLKFYKVRVVRLYRKNILKQAISQVRAHELMKEYGMFNLKKGLKKQELKPSTINLSVLKEEFDKLEYSESKLDEFITQLNPSNLTALSYEDLIESRTKSIEKICNFFDLTYFEPNDEFVKVTPTELRKALSNFDEVYNYFRGTRYAHMLDD